MPPSPAPEVPPGLNEQVSAALREAIAASFVDGFRLVMFIAVGLALLSALIAALMIGSRKKPALG